MNKPKFIGISAGRSGSVYISRVMNNAGIPNLHETIYNADNFIDGKPREWDVPELGCWSAQAIPFLEELKLDHVWHQTRHPLKVISSYLREQLFSGDSARYKSPQIKFMVDNFGVNPGHVRKDPLKEAIKFYITINEMCEKYSMVRWRVEDVDASLIIARGNDLGIKIAQEAAEAAVKGVGKRVNTRGHKVTYLSWLDLPSTPSAKKLKEMAERYGYND